MFQLHLIRRQKHLCCCKSNSVGKCRVFSGRFMKKRLHGHSHDMAVFLEIKHLPVLEVSGERGE